MSDNMDKYRDDYIREAKEHLNALNQALLILEKEPFEHQAINDFIRQAHTLKSMSAAMKYKSIELICHALEDLLDKARKEDFDISDHIQLMFECCDYISKMLSNIENKKKIVSSKQLIEKLANCASLSKSEAAKNNAHLEKPITFHQIEKIKSINVKVDRLNRLMNISEQLLMNKMEIDEVVAKIDNRKLTLIIEHFGRLINELQFIIVQTRLVPLEYIFNRFPRMVRDLANAENKKIDLHIQGGNIELDRAIVDELGECLIHLLRNAIDHGIESKAHRASLNKYNIATLVIEAKRIRNVVSISVSDDGAGLDIEKIREKALKQNLIRENATDDEVMQTIFNGLSTSQTVSTVSGRGCGLTIVKSKIESLGGDVDVRFEKNKGTTFTLQTRLSLAIIRVLFIEVNHTQYALPINNIIRLLKVPKTRLKQLIHTEAIVYEEEEVTITRLSQLFGQKDRDLDKISIVVMRENDQLFGIVVDRFDKMQDVVIKPLNSMVQENNFFSGMTAVGNGKVVLILDAIRLARIGQQVNNN